MEFSTTVDLHGKSATGMVVPEAVMSALTSAKRAAVVVTVNGYSYRSTVAARGGQFLIPVSADVRKAAGIAAGDTVAVGLVLDTEPREVEVPDDLAAALADAPAAKAAFDKLSYSQQRAHVLSVEGAKAAATRQRRVEKVIEQLV
ncbi:YdeI/OmpD-associated family protein [Actinokineospora bangkokensis]|uniref:Uncharacterized protein n=1 Tax=Actinokineospora bangkokensis TaxID=1193682 RepID=A0A1Q9LRB4_9PSEU|nr:YdeI/OmpD-associated family protein [Actinokineospora bangkokensis]OLR94597.1 hypothetical protein BJP25_12745 [Actinokineospora bangkokensis]